MKKGSKMSEESKQKMSDSWDYDKHFTEETCDKISTSLKLVLHTKEWNDNVSKSLKGRTLSEEHCKHISENHADFSGENAPMFNKKHSEESKLKISKNNGMKRSEVKAKIIGIKRSEETCDKISASRIGSKNPIFRSTKHQGRGNGSFYESPLQGTIWLRSSYEIKYAKYLDDNKILWYYEIETFDLGETSYTPDFFLPRTEKFIEIKGYMKERDQLKIDLFLEQYPWNLEVLRHNDLKKLGIKI